jgi:uncharacterized protein YecE (DUF72 family)
MSGSGTIYVGTSGWKYRHWNGTFYPKELRQKDQFGYYTENFATVKLNNSFYRQPSAADFAAWKKAAPKDFLFAVKANRYFTHLKKLKVSQAELSNFLDQAAQLGVKLGPVLFQLPPRWKINLDRLETFLKLLPQTLRFAFEFRNTTWYHPETYALLNKYKVAFCIYELAGHISPAVQTTNFIYLRLHGPGDKYQGSYNDKTLNLWARFTQTAAKAHKDVYVYFDNDEKGYAAFNAKRLQALLRGE